MKSAIIIGASRGIGRQIAKTFAKNGYGVAVAAKSTTDSTKLPGTIYSVADEISKESGKVIPVECNVLDHSQISATVNTTIDTFGRLDCIVYNAGAILWKPLIETNMKRFDLMLDVNIRGAYAAVQEVLPIFLKQKSGHIILVSPPIYNRFFKGKTPYAITKVGMTVLVHGLANELKNTGVSVSAIWPATVIESHVTTVKNVPPSAMRKADIFADACLSIANSRPDRFNGRAVLDEEVLLENGVTDFGIYRCDPNVEPPRMMPAKFPSLLVEEEDENLQIFDGKSKL